MAHLTLIHGLANKPPSEQLLADWLRALAGLEGDGLDLAAAGVGVSMVYWADVLYPEPAGVDDELVEEEESRDAGLESWRPADPASPGGRFAEALRDRLEREAVAVETRIAAEDGPTEERLFPLPRPLERRLMRALVRDAHHYLYGATFEPRPGERYDVRREARERFVAALEAGSKEPGPQIVVSHSMGTIIAYDCLKRVPGCPGVDGLVTLGSPLGLSEVQDGFGRDWRRHDGYPGAGRLPEHGAWLNFYDRLDVVCAAQPRIARDYRLRDEKVIEDVRVRNVGLWRHSAPEYLAQPRLQDRLRELLGL